MKKGLVVVFGLVAALFLTACNNKEVVDGWGDVKTLEDMQWSVSFTMDELNTLEESLFPVSYAYTTIRNEDWSITDSGEYIYLPEDKYLLPIDKFVVNKELSSSEVNNGLIYSMVDVTLDGGDMVSVLYINDPQTLKYSFATLYTEKETTQYAFNY